MLSFFLGIYVKTMLNSIIKGFKKANSIPTGAAPLPDHVIKLQDQPIIRVLRVIV
jgi:hypothetical protein